MVWMQEYRIWSCVEFDRFAERNVRWWTHRLERTTLHGRSFVSSLF